jgi:CheY-like chemotaxis protein
VPNGRETLAALGQSRFDLLLLDVNMPELDGFQAIRVIREHEKTSGDHLLIIALIKVHRYASETNAMIEKLQKQLATKQEEFSNPRG